MYYYYYNNIIYTCNSIIIIVYKLIWYVCNDGEPGMILREASTSQLIDLTLGH